MPSELPPRRVLILTGAGASSNLGANGSHLPMMSSWASDLVRDMGPRAEQIRLRPDMPGEEFEQELGRFLAFERSFPLIEPFAHLGTTGAPQLGVDENVSQWLATTRGALTEIRQKLLANLCENFGRDRIDDDGAFMTYKKLHAAIRSADGALADDEQTRSLAPESYLAHATTNYDTAIETAVEQSLDLSLQDGFSRRSGGASETYTPELFTGSDVRGSTAVVPVIHLHGSVGWYFRPDGLVTRHPSDEPYDDRRNPALLLPEDNKKPEAFEAPAAETWAQFTALLRMSTHVLVIGHSLHDAHVVDALMESETSIAVMIHSEPDTSGNFPAPVGGSSKRVKALLKGVVLIPGSFGRHRDGPESDFDTRILVDWLRTTGPRLHR